MENITAPLEPVAIGSGAAGAHDVDFTVLALAGFAAQLVDGGLGMGYGLTSCSILMAAGLSPSSASASVHFAELGTTALSGVAHHRFGNVDMNVAGTLAPAGAVGAFIGATLLSSLSTEIARPLASSLLLLLGLFVFGRFALASEAEGSKRRGRPCARLLASLGLIGGFVDATGGGGWGPVTTPALLANGRLSPSKVIGAVSAAEFVVTAAASAGFASSLGADSVHLPFVLALLAGGLFAAPLAACLVHKLPPRLLGIIVGGFICATHARVLLNAADASPTTFNMTYGALVSIWLSTVVVVARSRTVSAGPETKID